MKAESPDHQVLFESSPGLYLVLNPDLQIVAVTDAYLSATMTRRHDILGRGLFEVFPDNPDDPSATGVRNLRRSLERVLQSRLPDAMAVQKYDIRRPEAEGGGFQERFWSPLNTPVLSPGGELRYIIHRVEDVTEFVQLKRQEMEQHRLTEALQDKAGRMESEIMLRAQEVQETNRKLEAANQELEALYEKAKELDRLKTQLFSQQSEEARLASEERYRQLFEANPHPMWVCDVATSKFLAVNDAAIEKYGYSREEFQAMTEQDIVEPLESSTVAAGPRHKKKNSVLIDVETTSHELHFQGTAARLVAVTDITDKKKVEMQLLRTQRMESIGTLAGGVAHDLNNVLAPILLAIHLLRTSMRDEHSLRVLTTLETSAQRGAAIVGQLLTFARGAEGTRVSIGMRHLLRGMGKIVEETFPKSIRIEVEIPADLWMVTGDPTQLEQVVLNLCVNARDAMPQGGRLRITAENTILDEHYARLNVEAKPGLYAAIEVADNGSGIPQDIIDKIFEPFFTTKDIGKGTGLGLSTVRAIVKSHGGFINVYSEIGRGSRFKVFLPAQESADTDRARTSTPILPLGYDRLILVVDDEPSVRDITKLTLESHDYRVITANNGAEGVAAYARQPAEIAAVVLDMMMPVMDGPSTIHALEAINPSVKIVAASGLIDSTKAARISGASPSVRAILTKPYTAETLLRTLGELFTPGSR